MKVFGYQYDKHCAVVSHGHDGATKLWLCTKYQLQHANGPLEGDALHAAMACTVRFTPYTVHGFAETNRFFSAESAFRAIEHAVAEMLREELKPTVLRRAAA